MVEVEQGALRALEEDVLATAQRRLDQPGRVVEVVAQAVAPGEGRVDERVDLEGRPAHPGEDQVLVRQHALDPLAQDRRVEQVLHAQPEPPRAVAVGRPDPAAGRADLGAAEPRLVRLVERHVVRHDHVRAPADPDPADVDPARGQHVELVDQGQRD